LFPDVADSKVDNIKQESPAANMHKAERVTRFVTVDPIRTTARTQKDDDVYYVRVSNN
jgi:hypothetical protein